MKTLKITEDAHEGLDWLKELLNVPSYSLCIFESVRFFKENNISPRETISNNYSQSLFNFKKELFLRLEEIEKKENDNTERVIKINRRIEEDSIKPIRKNVFEIHSIAMDYYNSKSNDNLVKNSLEVENKISNETLNLDKIKELEKVIYEQDNNLKKTNAIIDEQDKKLKEYHRCLKILNEKVGFVDGLTGRKVYIDLPFAEVQNLFHLIP